MKVSITEVTIGDGDVATKGSTVTMRYRGTLDSDGSRLTLARSIYPVAGGHQGVGQGHRGDEGRGQARARHPSEARVRQEGIPSGDPRGRDARVRRRAPRRLMTRAFV